MLCNSETVKETSEMARVVRCCAGYWGRRLQQLHAIQESKLLAGPKFSFHTTKLLLVEGMEIKMPSLSPTMTEGTIVKWLKKEGDPIAPGDVLCEVETDKAVVAFETEEEGVLAKILVPEAVKDIKVGTLIGLMVAEGEDWKAVEVPKTASAPADVTVTLGKADGDDKRSPAPSAPPKTTLAPGIILGPAVKTWVEQYGVDASQLPGSGPKGRILKGDVLSFIKERNLKPQPPKPVPPPAKVVGKPPPAAVAEKPARPVPKKGEKYIDVEVTSMRRTIAKRLTESKNTIPHSYGTVEFDAKKLMKIRQKYKQDGIAVSVNDFIIKASAIALQQCPQVNAVWQGNQCVMVPNVDISVAVATDTGLITPIVKAADKKGVEDISTTVRSLAKKAREGKLKPDEFLGGSFTISNLGMFGISQFSAIINPPQCAILAVGSGIPVVDSNGEISTRIRATLCYDRRQIDEAVAAEFLEKLQELLEDPSTILLGSYEKVRLTDSVQS